MSLQPFNAAGGDTLAIVETSVKRRRQLGAQLFARSLVLLDADRLEADGDRGRQALLLARRERLELVFSRPSIEGTLLRMIQGHENRIRPTSDDAARELKRIWPDYAAPLAAEDLHPKFTLADLLRLAKFDSDIRRLLEILDLLR